MLLTTQSPEISLVERKYTLHNLTLPALTTNYVLSPVVPTYFSVW